MSLPEVMSIDELRAEFDGLARKLRGVSGPEFARQAREETLPDTAAVNYLLFILGALGGNAETPT